MKNFPCEYLFVDKSGDCFFKGYTARKKKTEINAHTLASLPVIFDTGCTVNTIFKLVEKNQQLKPILYYADEFLAESKKESEIADVNGKLRFMWDMIETEKDYFHVNYPKLEVDGIDENDEPFGIEFLGAQDIKNLELTFDNNLHVVDEKGNEVVTLHMHPTLFQVIYGLFWELSFFGNPKSRDKKAKEIKQALNDVKNGKYFTVDNLTEDLKQEL